MSEESNNHANYDSDKENITPYRSHQLIIFSYIEDKDTSLASEISDYVPNKLNSTTSALNKILEQVNVNDSPKLDISDDLISEVSFDAPTESEDSGEDPVREQKSKVSFEADFKTDESFALDKDKQASNTFEAKTPNSRRNPFDISTIDHFPEMSPSVFIKKDTDEFRWSIEHISEMNPADISGDQPSYILEAQKKEYDDDRHQLTVDSYFKNRIIAPSPCVSKSPATPILLGETKSCQTRLSFPKDFDLESLLGDSLGENCMVEKAAPSDNSFRRMLFEPDGGDMGDQQLRELSEPDYLDELQNSPVIKSDDCSPLSNSDLQPSFEICTDGNNPLNGSLLSPINLTPNGPKQFSNFRTPARPNSSASSGMHSTPAAAMYSTPGPSHHGYMSGFNTPGTGRRLPHLLMSTPGNSFSHHSEEMEIGEARTPASSNKRRLTPDKNPSFHGNLLFKNNQFSGSPFISPIPKSISGIKRHPKCPKKMRQDAGSERGVGNSPRKGTLHSSPATDSPDNLPSPASSLPSPVSNLTSPASSDHSPDALVVKQHMPMESSRIESGTDISSDGEREKTKMIQLGIQPLDISAIRPQDNTQKLRTNNYLDISDKPDSSSSYSPHTNNTCCRSNNTCSCTNRDDVRSKDSGFGTSSAMSTMASSILPPMSETNHLLALDSRPGKRKKSDCSPLKNNGNDSGLQPPPVKRVVIATDKSIVPIRRKHRSME